MLDEQTHLCFYFISEPASIIAVVSSVKIKHQESSIVLSEDGYVDGMEEWIETREAGGGLCSSILRRSRDSARLRSGFGQWDVDASCFLAALLPFASCIAFLSTVHSTQPSTVIVIPALAPLIIESPSTLSVAETIPRAHLLFLLDQPFEFTFRRKATTHSHHERQRRWRPHHACMYYSSATLSILIVPSSSCSWLFFSAIGKPTTWTEPTRLHQP